MSADKSRDWVDTSIGTMATKVSGRSCHRCYRQTRWSVWMQSSAFSNRPTNLSAGSTVWPLFCQTTSPHLHLHPQRGWAFVADCIEAPLKIAIRGRVTFLDVSLEPLMAFAAGPSRPCMQDSELRTGVDGRDDSRISGHNPGARQWTSPVRPSSPECRCAGPSRAGRPTRLESNDPG